MRFSSYELAGKPGTGVWEGSELHGLEAGAAGYPGSLDEMLASGADLAAAGRTLAAAAVVDLATLRFMPPVRRPYKILCVGLNYRAHSAETGLGEPDYPAVFARFASSLVGHGQAIVKPAVSDQLDYEAELVAVIGRRCKGVSKAEALACIAGYSIFNEASIRDYQMRTSQWTMGKNFDATGAFGPWLSTPDELPPGAAGLSIRTRLNGVLLQDGTTSDMVFGVADLVTILSEVMTLEPGDLIVTGTPSGVGFSRKPPVFMKAGDVCEVEIEGIGTLRNPITLA
ncbi:MAG: fumarylacetoacetate hydrolase [Spirochaetae bacterium HGW-Spirochaetae-7]|jgi:2-keto-4-pentenoate hydratase/2-oxohepta-3-ene-1,7-dioic acid hydratase in catechol pathway|nr:MAG: fumarylacetoacetate hydrolase [Spirochaetae bacterium HGW-Spirochaetae-7]